MNLPVRPPRDLLGRVRWAFLLAALVSVATSASQTVVEQQVPVPWRVVGVLLVLGVGAGSVIGHNRRSFGVLATVLGSVALVPIGVTMGDPFRSTELIYVVLFHQALFRSWRSTVAATAGSLLALAISIEVAQPLLPRFGWDIFEVMLQVPAVLLVGVIHILGVSIGKHERAASRERALATAAFVSGIVTLIHTLKMRAIGEGIETSAHAAQLRAFGCDGGQGYHFAHPMPAEAVERWLDDQDLQQAA